MRRIVRKSAKLFLQGALALLPLIITFYILIAVFHFAERHLEYVLIFIPRHYRELPWVVGLSEALAAGLIFFVVAAIGLLVRTFIGKQILRLIDATFNSLPGASTIYRSIKQMIELFSNKKDALFMNPVLVEYPSPGIWSLGFNTGEIVTEEPVSGGSRTYTVFIPTTPNPTSGFLCVVPIEKIRPLPVTTEDAVKMVLTGGIVKAGCMRGQVRDG
jgi:uncharacterized membrane protein